MMKYIGSTILIFCGFLAVCEMANATESAVPEPFQRFDATSSHTINYDDLTAVLNAVVLDVGRSSRERVAPSHAKTGTRMQTRVQRSTINEGNRFYFETFVDNEAGQQTLSNIRKSLEQVPADVPLEYFSRDEQLAYWLNLYNVTVLNEIIAVYPKRDLKKLLQGKNSILSKKLLTVAGVSLSLDDIQFTILKQNYDNNPLIIYGLYQGIIGGPNIRKTAYSGADVYRALTNNAIEFINSNRGTASRDGRFRVSSLYERNKEYFPNFNADLTAHLLDYLEGPELTELQAATTLKPDINDWTVTDLGGTYRKIGGSIADSNASLINIVSNAILDRSAPSSLVSKSGLTGRISPALLKHMQELKMKQEMTPTGIITATATIEELGEVPVEPDTGPVSESNDNN